MLRTAERPAMGSRAVVSADVDSSRIEAAHETVVAAEQRWSRFRPDSVVSQIREATGSVLVDGHTTDILDFAASANALTDGWFDAGLSHAGVCPRRDLVIGSPCLDLGGVAKGWTADLVADQLVADGASTAIVDVGGDARVRSEQPVLVECEAPNQRSMPAAFLIRDAGMAMSGPTRIGDHLLDPHNGGPARARVSVVVARTASGAEVLATAAAVAPIGEAVALLGRVGAAAWLIESDGSVTTAGQPERFLADSGWLAHRSSRAWMEGRCLTS
jgi:thiamine biosynthesis lipoprotein